ncbi:MAG TPA: helix-turn-helix transcriptional regulator [Streptosporangiaceae bacterium]|jgi:transcriptional regulator with XRE-family HTH domain|nr:helix-turn-helix transcriptional regulator [Streptosporangiaceae bacterium]
MAQPEGSSGVRAPSSVVRGLTAPPGGGPTVLRRLLGAQLRRLREDRRITLEDAGEVIRASGSKMSRLETGRVGFKDRDIADLLTFYEVTDDEQRTALRDLARSASAHGWWHDYSDVLPSWFEAYVGLEEAATSIRAYEIQFVPGLLQTEDYARAVTLLGHHGAPASEIEQRVALRMARQALLAGPSPTHLWAVLDEAVLRRPAGRPGVMRRQLQSLLEAAERPNVTIQIIPFAAGLHAAAGGQFSILRFAERDLPDIVYLEQLGSSLYLDKRETVDNYMAVMDRLCLEASPSSATAKTINAILRDR